MKQIAILLFSLLAFSGCANYQTWADWKNDRVGYRYSTVESCEIKNGAYVGKAKLSFGDDKGKVIDFYLKPLFVPSVPYAKDTVLFIEPKSK